MNTKERIEAFNKAFAPFYMMFEMSPRDQVQFKAVLEAEKPADIDGVIDIAENMWRYDSFGFATDESEFFKHYLLHHLDTRFDPQWLDLINAYNEGAAFANIKRGGILLIQMSVGALYMFSVPRGYQDGFNQWCKQVAAICLTAFMQTTLLYLGLLTFPGNMLLGLGIMLAANEVPRIAQQFGLDSSVRVNMMSVVHATTTAVNLTRSVARAAGK